LDITTDILQPQSVTFEPVGTKTFGAAPFDLSATASSALPVTFQSSNTNVATISGSKLTIVGAGAAIITATQNGGGTYIQAQATRGLTVDKAIPVLTITPIPSKVLNDAPFNIAVTTPSPGTITYETSNPAVATVNASGLVTIVGAGHVAIHVTQAATVNYTAVPATVVDFLVNLIPQTVTFGELPAATYG